MDSVTFRPEASIQIWSDLKAAMPKMAEMLSTDTDSLHIVEGYALSREYELTPFRDKVIDSCGPIKDLPLIKRSRMSGIQPKGFGIFLYQCQFADIKYCAYISQGDYSDILYLVIPKNMLFRFVQYTKRMNKKSGIITEIPILEDGLLEDIVQNTIAFLLNAKEIESYGVKIKRGIILGGCPGNGKTMICRYIQKLCSLNAITWGTITSSDIDRAYGENSLVYLFQQYTVSFFDDIDVGYMDRSKGNGKLACSLLTAMDGMNQQGHLLRIFTTNEDVKHLDKAFTRPGRIDKIINIKKPDIEMRTRLIESWPQEIIENIDTRKAATLSNDFSFAELEAIRTLLVSNKVMGDGTWELESAFDEFNERRNIDEEINKAGFMSSKTEKKKNKKKNKVGSSIVDNNKPTPRKNHR